MPTLKEILCTEPTRAAAIRDCVQLVDEEVKKKSGLTGLAVKGAYAVVTRMKPGMIQDVMQNLFDSFVDRLEPFYTSWDAGGRKTSFESEVNAKKSQVANALLTVTDDRAKKVNNGGLRKAYESLRPQGEKHVEAAVPGLATLVQRYVSKAS